MLLLGLAAGRPGAGRLPLQRRLPWRVLGFIGMMVLRSYGLLPPALADAAQRVSACRP
ncbi:hypothetical protein ACFQGW_00660 [Xanthomonas theicola]|nr:hypothetical protein [Xanthomonas theicola]